MKKIFFLMLATTMLINADNSPLPPHLQTHQQNIQDVEAAPVPSPIPLIGLFILMQNTNEVAQNNQQPTTINQPTLHLLTRIIPLSFNNLLNNNNQQ